MKLKGDLHCWNAQVGWGMANVSHLLWIKVMLRFELLGGMRECMQLMLGVMGLKHWDAMASLSPNICTVN